MKEINRIIAEAKRALEVLENGKTFTTTYVANRLEKAAEANPRDSLICHMRDVMIKKSANDRFISQREVSESYDHLYGLSGGRSNFRKELGDLLPDKHATLNLSQATASGSRIPYENSLDPMFGDSDLSKELAGVFSLDKKSSFSALSDNTMRKAEKFAKLQLISLGCVPQKVQAIRSNDHFILCNASVDTSDFTQVSVSIPVQVTNGVPALPGHFIQGDGLVKLNKENLYVFIKDSNNFRKKTNAGKFASERSISEFKVDTPVVPVALERYVDLENELVIAASSFSRDQIKVATGVVAVELSGYGVPNPQVRVAGSTAKTLTLSADIPTAQGRIEIEVPVDMPNGRPVIPSHFGAGGKTYKLSALGLRDVMKAASAGDSIGTITREAEAMGGMSYNQLIDRMIDGVSKADLRQAEDALSAVGNKFGGEQYKFALDKFSKLLKHSSGNTERDDMIKKALASGDLIQLPTSVQPYCPKLGLPVSKIDFDDRGRVVPMRRAAQSNDIDETGAMISSSKITLS